jgi:tagatose 1,6-diphosphate aldolase
MTVQPSEFRFLDPGPLVDGEIELVLAKMVPGDSSLVLVPGYQFEIRLTGTQTKVGLIKLRVGSTEKLNRYGGNLSYDVEEGYRGHRYAARGCRLLFPLARRHGLRRLLITCSPDNMASRRTCELMGATYIDTIDAETESGKLRPTSRFAVEM